MPDVANPLPVEVQARIREALAANADRIYDALVDILLGADLPSPANPALPLDEYLTMADVVKLTRRHTIQAVRGAAHDYCWRRKRHGRTMRYHRDDVLRSLPNPNHRMHRKGAHTHPQPGDDEPELPFDAPIEPASSLTPIQTQGTDCPPPSPGVVPTLHDVPPKGQRHERIIPARIPKDCDPTYLPGAVKHIHFGQPPVDLAEPEPNPRRGVYLVNDYLYVHAPAAAKMLGLTLRAFNSGLAMREVLSIEQPGAKRPIYLFDDLRRWHMVLQNRKDHA